MLLRGRTGRVLVDCGEDWLGRIDRLRPSAILVTHGHPDHAEGLKAGAPCPVYATAATWQTMAKWPLTIRYELPLRQPVMIEGFAVEAWPVQHSLNAPAVGFRISAGQSCIFYVPDVAALISPGRALSNVDVYVGDGAVLHRPLVRARGSVVIGHASVAAQLDWCKANSVKRAVFTHCGSGLVRADANRVEADVRSLGRDRGVHARVAYDGLTARL